MNNEPTPETDKQEFDEACNFDVDWPTFARTLELELSAAKREIEELKQELSKWETGIY